MGNHAAKELARCLARADYRVWLRGWPDILAVRGSELVAFEAKWGHDQPSSEQAQIAELLWRAGIPCFEVRTEVTSVCTASRIFSERLTQGRTRIIELPHLQEALARKSQEPVTPLLLHADHPPSLAGRCGECGECILIQGLR